MEIYSRIQNILNEFYGMDASAVESRAGGWSAQAFFVEDQANKYFLKVYNKKRPSSIPWITAMDRYIPLVQWLHSYTTLHDHTVGTVCTRSGAYKCEDGEHVYLLSEYIEGVTLGAAPPSANQIGELAKILGTLHASTPHVPAELLALQAREDFDIPYCNNLQPFLPDRLHEQADALSQAMEPYKAHLIEAIKRMRGLSASLNQTPRPHVLCHADAHGWNLMQGERLMLIDWECLKLAPPEQDLVLQLTEPSAPYFLNEYKKCVDYRKPDAEAFEYYWLKRRLEDIWEWVKDLRMEGLVKSEEHTMSLLRRSMAEISGPSPIRGAIKTLFGI